AALFEARDGRLEEIVPQGAYDPDGFLSRLPDGRPILFAGSGLDAYGDKLRAKLGGKAVWGGRSPFIAAEVARIGAAQIREGKSVDASSLEPLYFRKSQAEEPCRT
ncbi:MAG TPA: tRNA (adenosine(37)-N6)-threonylcarbamoyltransferase complex dimerization subunit type 1 TsaB, partial [Candidatus Bathyarchaeia archaeon]|nr:tRNA (adenosine(37)-N6)-threonylcarbamoyltransferase complex dimerization subunit type 1 TsaB [Candidatus Bathyarchaeia archaeon]